MSSVMFRCSICETRIYRGWFCWKCYKKWQDDILSNKRWTRFLLNEERVRRYRAEKEPKIVLLGDKWDIDTLGRLVRRDGYSSG